MGDNTLTSVGDVDNITESEKRAMKKLASERGIKLTEARREYLADHRGDYWVRQSIFGTYTPTRDTVAKLRAENGYDFDTDIAERTVRLDVGTRPIVGLGAENTPEALAECLNCAKSSGETHAPEDTVAALRGREYNSITFRGARTAVAQGLESYEQRRIPAELTRLATREPASVTLGAGPGSAPGLSLVGSAASGKTALLSAIHLGLCARYTHDQVQVARFTVASRRREHPAAMERDFQHDRISPEELNDRLRILVERRGAMSTGEINRQPVLVLLLDVSQARENCAALRSVLEYLSTAWEIGIRAVCTERRFTSQNTSWTPRFLQIWQTADHSGVTAMITPEQAPGLLSGARRYPDGVKWPVRASGGRDPHPGIPADSPLWDLVVD